MLVANLLKLAGALAMLFGVDPLTAYGLIGIGAAMYSPAKYGILSQMFGPAALVRANGLMEGSTIVAILMGVVFRGMVGGSFVELGIHRRRFGVWLGGIRQLVHSVIVCRKNGHKFSSVVIAQAVHYLPVLDVQELRRAFQSVGNERVLG